MEDQIQLSFKRQRKAVYVRFSEEEFKELEQICLLRQQKMQDFIKSVVFKEENNRPLMGKESVLKVINELNRIGNNFNQIARRVNSGIKHGWVSSFETCADDISKMTKLITKNVAS